MNVDSNSDVRSGGFANPRRLSKKKESNIIFLNLQEWLTQGVYPVHSVFMALLSEVAIRS